MEYSMGKAIGLATGIIFGLIICYIAFKRLNNDHKVKSEYDERQRLIRGRSYMFAFYGTIIAEALMMCLSMGGVFEGLPIPDYVYHFFSMFVGLIVLIIHSVWNGAYWGLNNNIKRYTLTFIFLFIFNLIPFMGFFREGVQIQNGVIVNFPFMNFFVIIMMIVLAVCLLAKKRIDNMEEGREDCL